MAHSDYRAADLARFPAKRRLSHLCNAARIAVLAAFLVAPQAMAAEFKPDFRTLGIGQKASELDAASYDSFACGSNGNVPLKALSGWTDFMQCAPDENGLREVTVEFGNRAERMSQLFQEQYNEELWIQQFGGTRLANFPVILSLLFDEDGVSRAFRAVTDSRAAVQDRGRAYLLRFRIYSHYGSSDWDCVRYPPHAGRTPVGQAYVDEVCQKQIDGKSVRVEAHVFRKAGQTGVDSYGMFEAGQFESMTRWDAWDASYPIKVPAEGENGVRFHGKP